MLAASEVVLGMLRVLRNEMSWEMRVGESMMIQRGEDDVVTVDGMYWKGVDRTFVRQGFIIYRIQTPLNFLLSSELYI